MLNIQVDTSYGLAPTKRLTFELNELEIRMFKGLMILLLCFFMQSCVFDPMPNLSIKIMNRGKYRVYIDELNDCDSCEIMQDVRFFGDGVNDVNLFPRVLNAGDSVVMFAKTKYIVKIDVINADSLENYFKHEFKYNVYGKPWVKVLSDTVDQENKTCKFIIK